jgi:hypothetical protein
MSCRSLRRNAIRAATLVSVVVAMAPCHMASAKDLALLTRYLVPVFLSQNFAAVCRAENPDFLATLPRGIESIDSFSGRLKKEVTDGLPERDAAMVVLAAADTALRLAEDEARKLSPGYPKWTTGELDPWCRDNAKPYILMVLQKDQLEHDAFLRIIGRAKQ